MHHKHFIDKISDHAVATAIAAAERNTTGHIRIFISHHDVADPVAAARRQFARLHMHATQQRNAVFLFIAPRSHKFAVLGDAGIHEKVGEQFWNQLVEEMAAHFKKEEWTEALLHAIRRSGEVLAQYFPHTGN